jgi:hypothetical protein
VLAHEPQQMALVIIMISAMPKLCGVNIVSPEGTWAEKISEA